MSAFSCLSDLRSKILKEHKHIEVTSFNGFELETSIGRFTLYDETILLDGKRITKSKELEAALKQPD